MMIGMTMAKIAVTLPPDVLRRARRAVKRGRAASLSAYVAEAIDQKTKRDDLDTLLDEMLDQSGGALTAAERRAADSALFGRKKKGRAA